MKTFLCEESVLRHNKRNCFPSYLDHYLISNSEHYNYSCLQQFQEITFFLERSWVICRNLLNVTQQGDWPRRIQWSGFWLVFMSTRATYLRPVLLGFLFIGYWYPLASWLAVVFERRCEWLVWLWREPLEWAASAIPPGSVKVQSMHIDHFSWGLSDVIFKETRDVIVKHQIGIN